MRHPPKEAEMAIARLQKVVFQMLKGGFSVKLGDWVSFFFTVNSDRVAKPEDVTATLIKQVNGCCRFGKEFKDSFERTEFVLVSKLQNGGLGYGLS